MKIIKRNCSETEFDRNKIYEAIMKAMKFGSGIIKPNIAMEIANEIESESANIEDLSVYDVENMVFEKLIEKDQTLTAKSYEGYRRVREFQRDIKNSTDETMNEMLSGTSDYWNNENSNKNAMLVTTQRDYMAGIESEDIARRMLLTPDVIQAHDDGILHFHDMDYYSQKTLYNCFHSKTRFVTSEGVKSFSEFHDGDTVRVMTKDGDFKDATVRCYGQQMMYDVLFTTSHREKTVTCTANHRWILNDGTVTTNLKVGDRLMGIKTPNKNVTPITYDECNAFALGLLIGDGCDNRSSNQHLIRLCGDKNMYTDILSKAGYHVVRLKDSDDHVAYKRGCKKQDFLNSAAWRYMDLNSKQFLFRGLYAADGAKDRNSLSTADDRVAELVRDISCLANYHITSERTEERSTNYAENSSLTTFMFSINQPDNLCWKVKSIQPKTKTNAWCVEEPVTHSFMLESGMITGNCCLINLEDMLQNGTVISGTMIEKPHTFSTACNIATQIIAQVASNQYGGQTISLTHLAPFVQASREKFYKKYEWMRDIYMDSDSEDYEHFIESLVRDDIVRGVQTIQYQVVTLMTTNG